MIFPPLFVFLLLYGMDRVQDIYINQINIPPVNHHFKQEIVMVPVMELARRMNTITFQAALHYQELIFSTTVLWKGSGYSHNDIPAQQNTCPPEYKKDTGFFRATYFAHVSILRIRRIRELGVKEVVQSGQVLFRGCLLRQE